MVQCTRKHYIDRCRNGKPQQYHPIEHSVVTFTKVDKARTRSDRRSEFRIGSDAHMAVWNEHLHVYEDLYQVSTSTLITHGALAQMCATVFAKREGHPSTSLIL